MVWIAIHQHCSWTCQFNLTVTVLSVILVSELGYNKVNSQNTTCGDVGYSDQTEYSRLTDLGFYLNTQNPAPCSGTVTTWEYCYYNSSDMTAGEYRAPFGIYRLNGNMYNLVSDMFVIVISNDDVSNGSFTCGTFTALSVPTIQEGDVVGVCNGLNDGTQAHLNLVGSSNTSDSVQYIPTSNNVCDNRGMELTVPDSVNTQGNMGLSNSPSKVLHLYANIEPVTTTEPPTTATMETTTPPLTTDLGTAESTTQTPTSETTAFNTPSSTGAIIGVIVALLLILIISIIAVLTVILVVRMKKSDSYKIDNVEPHTSDPNAIDHSNVMPQYDDCELKAVQLEPSDYEIPLSNHPEHNHPEASTDLVNTYDYTSFDPYEMEQNEAYNGVTNIPTVDNVAYGCNHLSNTQTVCMEKNPAYLRNVTVTNSNLDTFNVGDESEYDYV